MNKHAIIKRTSIYLTVIVAAVSLVTFFDQHIVKAKNQFKTIPFGNIMAEYFYFVNTNLTEHNLVNKELIDSVEISDPELAQFYRKLTWIANDKLITNYHSNGDSSWHSINADGSTRTNYLQYWQTIRPQMMKFYQHNLPNILVHDPVVHFRCSDSPFNKHMQYHLTTENSARWMAKKIKQQGFRNIILLSCNSHRTFNQTACQEYAQFYASVFTDAGLQVDTQCHSILQDFAIMVHSPLLVSLNVSSFSFMAGIAKDPAQYISCNMGLETASDYALQTEADWILDPTAPLLHKDVPSYDAVQDVIAKLRH